MILAIWGPVLKRDLLGETREEDKFHSKEELRERIKLEIKKQGEKVNIWNLDVSLVEDLSDLFKGLCGNVKSLDLSGWNTSNVENMSGMFAYCENLKNLVLSNWETLGNVKNMSYMFYKCSSLESLILSSWNNTKVEDMFSMFYGCTNLKSLALTSFDTSNVNDMSLMFANCKNLESLDLSNWDTSNVKDMIGIFDSCPAPYKVVNQIIKK